MRVETVMPVHNEAKYLLYSLPSLKRIENQIDEFIFVLDRCTDMSEQLIRRFFPHAKIFQKTKQKWRNPCAESFQYGYDQASGDIIWALGADIIVQPEIPQIIREVFLDTNVGTVCFRYLNYDLFSLKLRIHGFYDNLYRSAIQHFRKEARHTGFYAFKRQMMLEIEGLKDVPSEYDEFSRRVKMSKWNYIYIPYTNVLHLRPGLTKGKQFNQGRARFYLPQYNLAKTILHTFIHFKPHLLVGYLYERAINS